MRPGEVVFLHGLESRVDARGMPTGTKASYLRATFGAVTPALDTARAVALASAAKDAVRPWTFPFDGYEEAFSVPMARARAAITADTRLVIGSSFGGAVALRLAWEAPRWTGALLLLAGAGPKLTPHRTLPAGQRVWLVHGRQDDTVPFEDSVALAATSPQARCIAVDDGHRLASVVHDEALGAWVRALLGRGGGAGA